MVNAVAGQGLGVVLDSHGGGLGGTEGVDAEQVSQRAAVDADGLSDLEEPDQLQAVQALGAGLVAIDLRRPRVDGWVGGDQAVDVANRKKPRTACIAVFTEESISPDSPKVADVELDVSPLNPTCGSRALASHQTNQRSGRIAATGRSSGVSADPLAGASNLLYVGRSTA